MARSDAPIGPSTRQANATITQSAAGSSTSATRCFYPHSDRRRITTPTRSLSRITVREAGHSPQMLPGPLGHGCRSMPATASSTSTRLEESRTSYNSDLVNDCSRYISNIHTGYLGARFTLGRRAEISLRIAACRTPAMDTMSDQPRLTFSALRPSPLEPVALAYQTYPLTFESPFGRLSDPRPQAASLERGLPALPLQRGFDTSSELSRPYRLHQP